MKKIPSGWWKEWRKGILSVALVPVALAAIIWWNFPGPDDSFCSCPAEPFAHAEPLPLADPHRGKSHEYEFEFQRCNDDRGSHRFFVNVATGYARCVTFPLRSGVLGGAVNFPLDNLHDFLPEPF